MLPLVAIVVGFALLLWGAERFVEGAAAAAKHLDVQPLLIGVMIVGFGTSAPEMVVSAMAALDGNPDLALGNAYGSNIVNTGLILGLTALIAPISVHSRVVREELPLLLVIGAASGVMLLDAALSRTEALLLLAGFVGLIGWSVLTTARETSDPLAGEMEQELEAHAMTFPRAWLWLAVGLLALILSSRAVVWGAVEISSDLGVSNLVVGLTIVAFGTSLPELATSVVAALKGEHDIALGNVIGSNMFNLLAVVGIAAAIRPMPAVDAAVLPRDWVTMMAMIVALFFMAYGFRGRDRIGRIHGAALLAAYVAYDVYLVLTT